MKRRQLFKHALCSGLALALPGGRLFAAPEDYSGRFFVTLQATGAWDVASFCDPKINQLGERAITQWSNQSEIQLAGNIPYAAFANNAEFFTRHYQKILVVNGVDAQTNAHSTGVLHNWSGRNSAGFPSLTALFAAINAPNLPLAYINFGGYAETAKLIRYTRLNDINSLRAVLNPNTPSWKPEGFYRAPETHNLVQQKQQERLQRLRTQDTLLPHQQYTMDAYYKARQNAVKLTDFAEVIPSSQDLEGPVMVGNNNSYLRTQMQVSLLAFQSGTACSADISLNGFDTHSNNDANHAPVLGHLTDSLDYFWQYAEALGIADRITLMISSDFARTPYYNSSNGKDHWPIGSTLFMESNPVWGNRVVGATDEIQNALNLNADTLLQDVNGITLYPKHIHQAVRNYLGINNHAITAPFAFANTESLALFGS